MQAEGREESGQPSSAVYWVSGPFSGQLRLCSHGKWLFGRMSVCTVNAVQCR